MKITAMLQKIPEQIKRLSIVLIVIIGGLLAARYLVLPGSLLDVRFQQASTTQRESAREIKFAGAIVCSSCHDKQYSAKRKGFHKNLGCETCHGPAVNHTVDPGNVKPIVARERKFCFQCHAYEASRPTGFPQINPTLHNPLKACVTCHNPHSPEPPTVPQECSACHGGIARTVAVSRHALIGCASCHEAPKRHKQSPRSVQPTKPETREFCGKCHAREAKRADAPKVDLLAHGEGYLCWQCHYPHLPGGV